FFDPSKIEPYPYAPNLHIEQLLVNNIPYKILKEKYIGEAKSVHLDYDENTLSFEVFGVGFYKAKKNQIVYRLRGYADNWSVTKNGTFAQFTKVPPGKYVFEAYAKNANGVQSEIKTLPVIISPHWTQTVWFRWLSFLLFLLVLGLIYYMNIKRLERKKQIEIDKREAVLDVQKQLAHDLHDDLGYELSEMVSKSQTLLNTNYLDKKGLKSIHQIAHKSLESIEEMMRLWEKESDSLKNLLLEIESKVRGIFRNHEPPILVDIVMPEAIPAIMLNGVQRRNILQIVKECTNNIRKYARTTKVLLRVELNLSTLLIHIEDFGVGIQANKKRKGGRGLNIICKRAERIGGFVQIHSKKGIGTRVILNVPFSTPTKSRLL
ncbi:MAG: triple tyrosine motif-containing protein, partial [Bacteroidota bacterium]